MVFLAGLLAALILSGVALACYATAAAPRLEVRFSHFETNSNMRFAIVTVRNVGNAAAVYRGYAAQTEPGCDLQQRMEDGVWQSRILRCGTGLVDQKLYPGEEIRGTLFIKGSGNWRAGLNYRKADSIDFLPAQLRHHAMALCKRRPPPQAAWTPEMNGFPGED